MNYYSKGDLWYALVHDSKHDDVYNVIVKYTRHRNALLVVMLH